MLLVDIHSIGRQVISWNNSGLLPVRPLATYFQKFCSKSFFEKDNGFENAVYIILRILFGPQLVNRVSEFKYIHV